MTTCVVATFFFALTLGCLREKHPTEPGVYITEKDIGIEQLDADDPVLYVNGEKITKRDFMALLVLRDKLWRLQQRLPLEPTPDESEAFLAEANHGIMMELIHRAMFRQYAKEINAIPSEASVKQLSEQIAITLYGPGATIDGIANMIGGDAGNLFRKVPVIDAQDALLRQSVTTNDLENVSEAEIKEREEFVAKFDANADELNAKAAARLMEAKTRILAGADFAEEAANIAEAVNPQFGKMWGTFEIQEFPADEELHQWLLTAQEGDISDPLDLEDGIAIVKLLAKGKGEAPFDLEPPDAYTLARCTTQAFDKMQFQDREQMSRQLLIWKQQAAQRQLGAMLSARAVVEYPNGTNLFLKVEESYRQKTGIEDNGGNNNDQQ